MNHHTRFIALAAAMMMTIAAPAEAQLREQDADGPYRLSWQRDAVILGVAGAASILGQAVTRDHDDLTPEELAAMDRSAVFWLDRSATRRYSTDLIRLSERVGTPLTLAPLVLLIDPAIRSDWGALGVMYIQTTLLAGATSTIAKETISRYRPYVYNSGLTLEERTEREPGKAFFSSAATGAFAHAVLFATVFSDHHPDSRLKPYVWGASLTAAGAVGYLRYASGIHYPTDVIVGALVGSTIGYAVPRMHRVAGDNLSVSPAFGSGVGLSFRITH